MRWLVILLLVVNGIGWYWWSARQDQRAQAERPSLKAGAALSTASDNLPLLSEIAPQKLQQGVALQQSSGDASTAKTPPPAEEARHKISDSAQGCLVLGPIASEAQADGLRQRLDDNGIRSSLSPQVYDEGVDYWVYLPPLPTARQAARVVQELERKGFDSFVFPAGEFENGISLGVFPSRESALRHRDQVAGAGYSGKLNEVPRRVRRYWILLSAASAESAPDIKRLDFITPDFVPHYIKMPCKTVASGAQFQ